VTAKYSWGKIFIIDGNRVYEMISVDLTKKKTCKGHVVEVTFQNDIPRTYLWWHKGHDIVSCSHDLTILWPRLSNTFYLVTRGHDIVSRAHKINKNTHMSPLCYHTQKFTSF
jgi:hypothetical protein